jgi:hypothetical protein
MAMMELTAESVSPIPLPGRPLPDGDAAIGTTGVPAPAAVRGALLAAVPPLRRRQTVASIDEEPYRSGDALPLGEQQGVSRRPVYLGFIDLAPGNTWPHDCLYVLCRPAGGRARTIPGRHPPQLAEGRRLTQVARGEDVPPWGAIPPYESP